MLGFTAKTIICTSDQPSLERISVILPVLNEAERIARALDSLVKQPEEVVEILVVDGGSTDGTQTIVAGYGKQDHRVKLLDASPVDPRWTGKVWGLRFALQRADRMSRWILASMPTCRPRRSSRRSLLAHVERGRINVFSVATQQRLSGKIDGLLHPAMLADFDLPFRRAGSATTATAHRVQANGPAFLLGEDLVANRCVRWARASLCEDITIARRLTECGEQVGFYESEALVEASMYDNWRETWNNWPRSLSMRDQYFGWREGMGSLSIIAVQALPLPVLIFAALFGLPTWILLAAGFLTTIRAGILIGAARAYPARPWTYWFSPLADLPVALRIVQFTLRRRHTWRGRTYVRVRGGAFELSGAANELRGSLRP